MTAAIYHHILHAETNFPAAFAHREQRPGCIIHYTPDVPDSYDGNHAVLLPPLDSPAEAIANGSVDLVALSI